MFILILSVLHMRPFEAKIEQNTQFSVLLIFFPPRLRQNIHQKQDAAKENETTDGACVFN